MEIPKFDSYWQYVEYWSGIDPDFPSMRDDHRTVTAQEFQDKTEQLAKVFLSLGVQKGDRIATILPQSIDCILVMIAANKVGAILVANGISSRSPYPVFLPPSHIGGTVEIIGMGIIGGHEMIMMESWSPSGHLELVQKEKLEWIGGVPTMIAIMLSLPNFDRYDLSSVKLCFMSGEKVSSELWEAIKARICQSIITGYGSTETGAETNITNKDDDIAEIANGYVGRPTPGVKIKICNDDEKELPAGETGEVTITGPFSIKSYFRMAEEDRAGFTSDGWVKTGDLGYLTEDGRLYIKGRKKHIIRVGSYTVLPTEIEEVVIQLPEVAIAAAIGVPDKIYGEETWLYVVPEAGQSIDIARIIELCKQDLAKFKVPKKVFVTDSIPLTRIGKADRRTLREEVLKSFV